MTAQQSQVQMHDGDTPPIPALRTFRVRRFNPLFSDTGTEPRIEELIIEAHVVECNGPILSFIEYSIDEETGPTAFVRRSFYGWTDYEEVMVRRRGLISVN